MEKENFADLTLKRYKLLEETIEITNRNKNHIDQKDYFNKNAENLIGIIFCFDCWEN